MVPGFLHGSMQIETKVGNIAGAWSGRTAYLWLSQHKTKPPIHSLGLGGQLGPWGGSAGSVPGMAVQPVREQQHHRHMQAVGVRDEKGSLGTHEERHGLSCFHSPFAEY